MLLPASVNGSGVKFLIDSGSTATILSHSTFLQIEEELRPVLDITNELLTLADGKNIPISGRAEVTLEIGPLEFTQSLIVADIQAEGILGNDFLKPRGCTLDYRQGCVRIDGVSIYYEEAGGDNSARRIVVSKTVSIPAGQQMVLAARIMKRGKCSPEGLIQGSERFMSNSNLMIGKSVVTSHSKTVPLRILNLTNEPQIVYQGTHAGMYHPIQEVITDTGDKIAHLLSAVSTNQNVDERELPEHVQGVFERSMENLTVDQQGNVRDILCRYQDIFAKNDDDMGKTDLVQHTIDTGYARPVKQAPRRLPIHQRKEAEDQVKNMLERGVIEKSSSPWAAPVVLVKKKDGSTRFCVDYRKLNELTLKDAYPLPKIDESLDALSGSQWFSTLDLCSGYWQVGVDPQDRPKTAFTTGSGLYQFTVMPFGLCNAPSTFERLMEMTLQGLQWDTCLIYLDDLIIHAKSFEVELSRLQTVFDRLRLAGLKLKPKKCELF